MSWKKWGHIRHVLPTRKPPSYELRQFNKSSWQFIKIFRRPRLHLYCFHLQFHTFIFIKYALNIGCYAAFNQQRDTVTQTYDGHTTRIGGQRSRTASFMNGKKHTTLNTRHTRLSHDTGNHYIKIMTCIRNVHNRNTVYSARAPLSSTWDGRT
jgi:hypothetical protein